jgi:hypothetical protein
MHREKGLTLRLREMELTDPATAPRRPRRHQPDSREEENQLVMQFRNAPVVV